MAGRFAAFPVLALTTWSLVGCYSYVPITAPQPAELSGSVHVTLTANGTEALKNTLGANVREIGGVVVRSSVDSLVMTIEETISVANERYSSTGNTVALSRSFVQSVAVRRYSRKRSIVLGLILTTFAIVTLGIAAGSSGSSGTGQPGPPQP